MLDIRYYLIPPVSEPGIPTKPQQRRPSGWDQIVELVLRDLRLQHDGLFTAGGLHQHTHLVREAFLRKAHGKNHGKNDQKSEKNPSEW